MDWTLTMAMPPAPPGAEEEKPAAPAPRAPVGEQEAAPEPRAPAADQVVVGCIPREPPGFQRRAGLLADLDADGTGVSVLYATAGRQGAGTTQLAAAYARAIRATSWRLVAWVNAEDAGTLRAGLAVVADALGLPEGGPGPHGADPGLAVRHRLEAD
jgi:hypothetical protein